MTRLPEKDEQLLRKPEIKRDEMAAALLGKVLPTTLQADESSGGLAHLKTASGINCRRNRVAKNRRPIAMKRGTDG